MDAPNIVANALEAGAQWVIDAVTGRQSLVFRRRDYDDEQWKGLLDGFDLRVLNPEEVVCHLPASDHAADAPQDGGQSR